MNVKWVCKECNSTNTCEKANQMKCFVCGTIRTNEVLFDCEPSKPTAYSPSESEDTPDALYERAEKCFKAGSLKKAFDLYRRAAELGHANAQNKLSSMYEFGQGTERDLAQALFWCQKAANQGHAAAKTRISKLEGTAKPRFALFLPEHSTAERWLLVLGWVIILAYTLLCLTCYIRAFAIGELPLGIGPSLIVVTYFILPAARRQYCIWNQVTEDWKPARKWLNWIYEMWAALAEVCAFGVAAFPLMALIPDFPDVGILMLFMGFPFYTIYYICCFFWRRRRKKKA